MLARSRCCFPSLIRYPSLIRSAAPSQFRLALKSRVPTQTPATLAIAPRRSEGGSAGRRPPGSHSLALTGRRRPPGRGRRTQAQALAPSRVRLPVAACGGCLSLFKLERLRLAAGPGRDRAVTSESQSESIMIRAQVSRDRSTMTVTVRVTVTAVASVMESRRR